MISENLSRRSASSAEGRSTAVVRRRVGSTVWVSGMADGWKGEHKAPEPADDESNGITLAVMSAAAVSGFVMGLMVRGEGLIGLTVAVLAFALVWFGWWLRGAADSADAPEWHDRD